MKTKWLPAGNALASFVTHWEGSACVSDRSYWEASIVASPGGPTMSSPPPITPSLLSLSLVKIFPVLHSLAWLANGILTCFIMMGFQGRWKANTEATPGLGGLPKAP